MNDNLRKYLWYFPRKKAHSILHYESHNEKIDWKNPKTYDEKIRWLLVNCYGKKQTKYVDKYEAREYIKQCGLEHILIPIYGVWKSSNEINIENLPKRFILKANHGSGEDFYAIIKDKSNQKLLKNELRRLDKSLKYNFARLQCEYQYNWIKPRLIAEEYLEDGNKRISDYKILCFNGEAKYILVCSERDNGRDYFDTSWNYIPFVKKEFRSKHKILKPKNLELMIKYAEIISKPFNFARIDFYNLNGKIYFGEITLTPAAGMNDYITHEAQLRLGNLIEIPQRKRKIKKMV